MGDVVTIQSLAEKAGKSAGAVSRFLHRRGAAVEYRSDLHGDGRRLAVVSKEVGDWYLKLWSESRSFSPGDGKNDPAMPQKGAREVLVEIDRTLTRLDSLLSQFAKAAGLDDATAVNDDGTSVDRPLPDALAAVSARMAGIRGRIDQTTGQAPPAATRPCIES